MPPLAPLLCIAFGLASVTGACDTSGRDGADRRPAERDGTPRSAAAGATTLSAMAGEEQADQTTPTPELRAGDRRIAIATAPRGGDHAVMLTIGSGTRVARAGVGRATAVAWVRRARDLVGRPVASKRPAAKIMEEAPLRGESDGVVLTLARTVGPGGRPIYRVAAAATPDRSGPGPVVISDLSAARARAFIDAVDAAVTGGAPGRASRR